MGVSRHFSESNRKKSDEICVSSEIELQEWKSNKNILWWRKPRDSLTHRPTVADLLSDLQTEMKGVRKNLGASGRKEDQKEQRDGCI